ncbi:uncharacterized protein LOC125946696 [Dermacentor silvarum]|uniref:uncharacterized protein LOC125946696 n=1 Tax=Dermacentor silvarum TaxID=543639 RepID=UPI002101B7DB|nr:uncharacterized protein LOC125946696 [Dermacentor silvarum]
MMKLSAQLEKILGIRHALYADDITIWTVGGSIGEKQDALQEAVDVVASYAETCRLQCAPEKSELLIIEKRSRGRSTVPAPTIHLRIGPREITKVDRLRILGLHLQKDGGGGYAIQKLQHTTTQVLRMIQRITSRRRGLKEQDLIRLVQALIVSRIAYSAPYLNLRNAEVEVLDRLIRKAYKQALGLPPGTATFRLEETGVYNNAREIIEAHLVSQKERLLRTIARRCVLERLGYSVRKTSALTKIPTRIQETMYVSPIPRNMHPNFHIGRRQARAQALARKYGNHPNVLYIDAASTARSTAFVTSVVDNHGTEINASSVSRVSAAEAEELAIALAITT